ncbi:MAG: prepilin-type N-terminal cleavage/methylation domain-containing protein [Saccharofermentans sp.]|nr:prepilin-type N-terminal cleavage/methylation domain-containing protein [Saccharofermentans sp.]
MKRFVKFSGRKGFTLVETLLATVILVIVSTMLVNGFVSTMGYSYQTSVYIKSGGNNYAACMDKVADWQTLENTGTTGREALGKAYYAGGSGKTELTFDTGSWPASLEPLYVHVEKHDDMSLTVPDTVKGYEFSPKKNQLADNRTSFIYYPEFWEDSTGGNLGKIIVMYVESENKYYWVVDNGNTDLSGAKKVSSKAIGAAS